MEVHHLQLPSVEIDKLIFKQRTFNHLKIVIEKNNKLVSVEDKLMLHESDIGPYTGNYYEATILEMSEEYKRWIPGNCMVTIKINPNIKQL